MHRRCRGSQLRPISTSESRSHGQVRRDVVGIDLAVTRMLEVVHMTTSSAPLKSARSAYINFETDIVELSGS